MTFRHNSSRRDAYSVQPQADGAQGGTIQVVAAARCRSPAVRLGMETGPSTSPPGVNGRPAPSGRKIRPSTRRRIYLAVRVRHEAARLRLYAFSKWRVRLSRCMTPFLPRCEDVVRSKTLFWLIYWPRFGIDNAGTRRAAELLYIADFLAGTVWCPETRQVCDLSGFQLTIGRSATMRGSPEWAHNVPPAGQPLSTAFR